MLNQPEFIPSKSVCNGLLASLLLLLSHTAMAERLLPCDVLTGGVLLNQEQVLVAGVRGQLLSKALSVSADDCSVDSDNGWHRRSAPAGRWTGLKQIGDEFWLLGHQEALYQKNAGQAWVKRHLANDSDYALMDIVGSDGLGKYFAVGTRGVYLVSDNGGQDWQPQDLYIDPEWEEPEDFNLNAIIELPRQRLLVAGEAGVLYWSKDGDDWKKDHADYDGTWFGASALEKGGLIVYGFAGHVAYAKGYRKDWTLWKGRSKASLFASLELASGRVLLAGENGELWSWQPNSDDFQRLDSGTKATITSLLIANNEVLMTTDQGLKRTPLP